jgi:hypothetical protein
VNSDGKNTDKRDAAIRNLIARRRAATLADSCPDADILAAYSERTLGESEAAQWEAHFAVCERCQDVLGAIALSAPVESEALAAASAAPAVVLEPREKSPGRKLRLWYWLAPAAGLATAGVLWFALRPAHPLPAPSVAQLATNAGSQVQPPAQPPPQSQAVANAPAMLALQESKRDAGRPLAKKQPAERAAAAPQVAAPLGDEKSVAAAGAELQSLNAAAGQNIAGALPAAAPAPPPPASPQDAAADKSFTRMRKAEARSGAVGGAVATTQGASAGAVRSQSSLQAGAGLLPAQISGTPLQTTDGGLVKIFPENGDVIWRIGHGGRIEKSTGSEQTWQKQESGVTSDLLAGSAPSNDVCWISGMNGTILRTTDGGAHWTRITSPTQQTNVTPDWTSVTATDASHATVTMPGGTAFVTGDGGNTWKIVRQ